MPRSKSTGEPHHYTIAKALRQQINAGRRQKESGTAVIDNGAGTTNVVILEEG
ncbi:MAG: hypothetical protein U0491_03775 [Candidatus Saccharimonadales bacterium]